jgi:hypothetical protein
VAWSSTSLNQRFALSYTGDRWNLTADFLNVDLTASGDVLSSPSGNPLLRQPHHSTGRGESFLRIEPGRCMVAESRAVSVRKNRCVATVEVKAPAGLRYERMDRWALRFSSPSAVLKPLHLPDFVDLGATWSLDLYGGARGLADQRPRDG